MSFDVDSTFGEYAEALKTADRVRTLTGFYDGDDPAGIEDRVDVSAQTVENYLDTFDTLGFVDQDAGEVCELGEYVSDMASEYSADELGTLFGTVRDELGIDIVDRVSEEETISMSDVAADHDVAPATASNRYDDLEDAGFAVSSRKRRWKTYDLTEKGEDAVEHLQEFAEQVDQYGAVDSLDRIAQQVGTLTEEQHDEPSDRVVEEEFESREPDFSGYEGWESGQ